MDSNPHKGHRRRLRARFKNEGIGGFEPHQVLELLLFYALPRRDTNNLAHSLLSRFGSIDKVFEASFEDLCSVPGIGENAASLLRLIPEISQYYIRERYKKKDVYETTQDVGEFMCSKIGLLDREVFAAAAFSARRQMLGFGIISEGTVSEAPVQMRLLTEFAINSKAETIVIAHNHVSGSLIPSQSDRDVTKSICRRLSCLGITVTDHIIVSGDKYYSFTENCILPH